MSAAERTPQVTCTVDGRELSVPQGRTVAAAMMLEGGDAHLRTTRFAAEPRGVFCGIGVCFDCLVRIDGAGPLRACLVEVADGMRITRHGGDEDQDGDHHGA